MAAEKLSYDRETFMLKFDVNIQNATRIRGD